MTKLDEIEARLSVANRFPASMQFDREDIAYLLAEVKRLEGERDEFKALSKQTTEERAADIDALQLIATERDLSRALHTDALAGWNKSIDRVAELGAERNEIRALALSLAEALEAQLADEGYPADECPILSDPRLVKIREGNEQTRMGADFPPKTSSPCRGLR